MSALGFFCGQKDHLKAHFEFKKPMKQQFTVFMLVVLALISFPKAVSAAEKEAGVAGQLASYSIEENDSKPLADRRIVRLKAYLSKHNSPLTNFADSFVHEADQYGLDWKLVAAIAGVESTFGQFIPTDSYNAWGWAVFTGQSYGAAFKDWKDGIATVSQGLHDNYLSRGLTSVEAMGTMYAASPAWAGHVLYFMKDLDAFTVPEAPAHTIAMSL